MAYPIQLPQVGESVTEAVIGKWLKAVGDHVDKYDPLVEVVTDKVNMEFPAPVAGTITELLAHENDTVPMGSVIAHIDPDDPNVSAPMTEHAEDSGSEETRPEEVDRVGRMVTGANVGPTGGVFSDTSTAQPPSRGQRAEPRGTSKAPERATDRDRSRYFSPVVTRLAQQHGIDLTQIQGTGLGGRVTKRDVQAAIAGEETGRGEALAAQAPGEPRQFEETPGQDRIVQPSPVRRIIASNMARSWREIPHAWTTVEVDVTPLVSLREGEKEHFHQRHGVSLTYVAFHLHAIAAALRVHPQANASWQDETIRLYAEINIGVAVAAPDGLVVPVVRNADRRSVGDLARELGPLVERARAGRLSVDDVRGGTFTLNNTGALGSVWGGAIINYPQAAIINTEAIVKRPVVVSGSEGDAIAVRSMMNLCLSFDHRILDGAEASAFVHDVKERLEGMGPGFGLEG